MKAAGKPYRTGRGNEEYEKGYEEGGEGVIIGTGKGGGGRLSFRDADVVPFTFDLDFPEGLSCRESTVDESGGKAVPYRLWK